MASNPSPWGPWAASQIAPPSSDQKVPHQTYQVNPQNVVVGIAGLLVLAYLAHKFTKKGGRK